MKCPHCNETEHEPGAIYCHVCGYILDPEKAELSKILLKQGRNVQDTWERMRRQQESDAVNTNPKWTKPLRFLLLAIILIEYIIISIHESQFGSWGLVSFGYFNTFAFILTMVLCLFANSNFFDDKKGGWRKYYEWLHFIPSAILPILGYLTVSNIQNLWTLIIESSLLGILFLVNFGTIETFFDD